MKSDLPPVKTQFIPFAGGLDTDTPAISKRDGTCREAQNFECSINGGYSRVAGYERFDGQAAPSDAAYAVLGVTVTGSFAVGNTITGVDSTATGVIVAVPDSTSLVITKITGTFNSSEVLNVGGSPQGSTTSLAIVDGASTASLHNQYKNLAADSYRSDIAAVTGSGDILGVVMLNDVVYAFRNNAGGTAAAIYKSSSSGWTAVTLHHELAFTAGGAAEPAEGETITQGGVTATLKRVVLTSGTWGGSTAAGRLIVTTPAGGNFAAGAITFSGGAAATASGAQTAITILPDGRYEFDIYNFGGGVNTNAIYGCDGVNRGFEFDGTIYVPITTGMTTDTPDHVAGHKNHLFFSFGESVQHSSTGFPYQWSPVTGASEIAMGDDVTAFMPLPSSETAGALAIYSRNKTSVLYGSSSSDWNLVTTTEEAGALPYTVQYVGSAIQFDDRGITSLAATQAYGNFASATLSQHITTWLTGKRSASRASCICRDKNQYRLFFTDNYGVFLTIANGKVVGLMPVLFADAIKCIWSSEKADGSEAIYFGSSSGWVYQMEKGTSFDGDAIEAYLYLAFNFGKSPRINKRYRRAVFELSGSGYAGFNFTYELGYAATTIPQPSTTTLETSFRQVNWDTFVWDAFVWDGTTLAPSDANMLGTAENVSIIVTSNSDYYSPVTFSGVILQYTPRRLLR